MKASRGVPQASIVVHWVLAFIVEASRYVSHASKSVQHNGNKLHIVEASRCPLAENPSEANSLANMGIMDMLPPNIVPLAENPSEANPLANMGIMDMLPPNIVVNNVQVMDTLGGHVLKSYYNKDLRALHFGILLVTPSEHHILLWSHLGVLQAAVLYEYETFKATEGELLLDTYIRYLQVINNLKKCGYSKDNCELNFKFLNNLQPEWKQYVTMMRQNKNLMDINIDALYNILKQNQGDVNDAMGSKKKNVMVTSDPLALIAEKTKVSKVKRKLLFLWILKEVMQMISVN
nr:Gag-Pol polyprotein [Tanacetum cinerariifolium]